LYSRQETRIETIDQGLIEVWFFEQKQYCELRRIIAEHSSNKDIETIINKEKRLLRQFSWRSYS
jgi:hypothetical protein